MKILTRSVIFLTLAILAGSTIINISSQLSVLSEARKKNQETEKAIKNLEIENNELKMQIAYATSSAFIEQQARDKFGLGTEDDYWLETKDFEKMFELFSESEKQNKKPMVRQWIDLFTR